MTDATNRAISAMLEANTLFREDVKRSIDSITASIEALAGQVRQQSA